MFSKIYATEQLTTPFGKSNFQAGRYDICAHKIKAVIPPGGGGYVNYVGDSGGSLFQGMCRLSFRFAGDESRHVMQRTFPKSGKARSLILSCASFADSGVVRDNFSKLRLCPSLCLEFSFDRSIDFGRAVRKVHFPPTAGS